MYTHTTQPISEYLSQKGITYRESGTELITRCIFSDCDSDSTGSEAHLYFSKETGQYECKKCGEKGNLVTLRKHFGDSTSQRTSSYSSPHFNDALVEKCHTELPGRIRTYLNNRGIKDEVIDSFKLGYGTFYGKRYITIPVAGEQGCAFFKLRQDPEDGDDKITYPKGANAQLFGVYAGPTDSQILCEGELDALALISEGYKAVTSTHGAGTFKAEWITDNLSEAKKVYVCFDNDEAGKKGSLRVLKMLEDARLESVYQVTLPEDVGDGGDVTDYLTKLKYPVEDLLTKYSEPYPEAIDVSQFEPITPDDLAETLSLTIKGDRENKIITFLCQLSAYTERAQLNVSFNSPSSTGKSYIALEIANLFPDDDVLKLGNCSKTAFFHEQGVYDKETNEIVVDISRKIIIFTDAPHTELLSALRSLLSHDEKVMRSKITDKNEKGGNRTKTVALIGYPAVIFCTAGLKMDPQEMTRFILLSPDINQEKIRAGITATISREANPEQYAQQIESDPARMLLKLRIEAIKREHVMDIKIANYEEVERRFLYQGRILQPRHQRDIKRLMFIIKCFALLNLWWRERDENNTIIANNEDIEHAFAIWDKISTSQELNIPPYVYELYTHVFVPAFEEKNVGLRDLELSPEGITRDEIMRKYYEVYQRRLNMSSLRFDILPTLDSAGLITRGKDKNDLRQEVVFIPEFKSVGELENNSVEGCGVEVELLDDEVDSPSFNSQ